jgi:hypothetical protein
MNGIRKNDESMALMSVNMRDSSLGVNLVCKQRLLEAPIYGLPAWGYGPTVLVLAVDFFFDSQP